MKKGYVSVWGRVSFVGMLFLVFEKSDEQKNCARNFPIHKYAFLVFEKSDKQKKIASGILRFVSMLF